MSKRQKYIITPSWCLKNLVWEYKPYVWYINDYYPISDEGFATELGAVDCINLHENKPEVRYQYKDESFADQ